MSNIEIPVGTRIKVMVGENLITADVVEKYPCKDCVLRGDDELCGVFECRDEVRTDGKGVGLKKVEGGKE